MPIDDGQHGGRVDGVGQQPKGRQGRIAHHRLDLSAKGEIVLADNKGDDELVY